MGGAKLRLANSSAAAAAIFMAFCYCLDCGAAPIVFLSADTQIVGFDSGVQKFAVREAGVYGITTLNGNVLVADYMNNAILMLSPNGDLLNKFASFFFPAFLESDLAGNVYATSVGGAEAPSRFGVDGVIAQTFYVPYADGIDADALGNVYVVSSSADGRYLYKFAPDGNLLNITAAPMVRSAADIAIDERGQRLYLTDEFGGGHSIDVFDISGLIPTFTGSIATPENSTIEGVAFDSESGHILVVDFGLTSSDPRGLEYSSDGMLLHEYRPAIRSFAFDITTLPVPEPASAALVGMAVICGLVRRTLTPRRVEAVVDRTR